jgi:hypothetical protein
MTILLKFFIFIIPAFCFATGKGNLSLPKATQIAPLVSFGQLLFGEGVIFSTLSGSYTEGPHSYNNTIVPELIYGIRDTLSISLFAPISIRGKSGPFHSSGIEDLLLQLEYGYLQKDQYDYSLQGSIVGNVQFPTGSDSKNPPTGKGGFSYFAGTTFSYLSVNWYAFLSPGVNLLKSSSKNSYLYQGGFARYIPFLSPPAWVFDLMVEFDGSYSPSTGNSLLITPSLWLASNWCTLQGGIGLPLIQNKNKISYSIDYSFGLAFQF